MEARQWLILGATSYIAISFARQILKKGDAVCLVARDASELANVAADLSIRTEARVVTECCDLLQIGDTAAFIDGVVRKLGGLDSVFVATGELGDQTEARQSLDWHDKILISNFTGICRILHPIANRFEQQKKGLIAVLSSVAGDRGRQSNYIYGAAKAGMSAYLQGLRNRLHTANVQVLTVKLGFTDTRMIYGKVNSALVASPPYAAQQIVKGIEKKRDVIYVPAFWSLIMFIIRSIPERLFKKLSL